MFFLELKTYYCHHSLCGKVRIRTVRSILQLTVNVVGFPHVNDVKLGVVSHHLVGGVSDHGARVGKADATHRRLHLQCGIAGARLHIPDPARGKVGKAEMRFGKI